MKTKITRGTLMGIVMSMALILPFLSALFDPGTRAAAAGKTDIRTLSGTEQVTHSASSGVNNYTEEYFWNTGIRIYGVVNNSVNSTGNEIKIDSSAVCLDFSEAKALRKPKPESGLQLGFVENEYDFEILQGSTIKWKALFIGSTYVKDTTDENGEPITYTKKTINVNGKTTVTTSEAESYTTFQVSDFGTQVMNLKDGAYTVKITRRYRWTHWKSILTVIPYNSTSVLTGRLVVDTAVPVLSAKGASSGTEMPNNAMTNERVTVSVGDANPGRLYYKTPSGNGYTSTTAKSYTSGTLNGWYYVYAVDGIGNRSEELSFYYDSVKPEGTLYGGTAVRESGDYAKAEYVTYIASDTGSGIAGCYVKMPGTSYYTSYASGTQLINEGTYCFKCMDRSGNTSSVVSITLDRSAPTGTLYAGETIAGNGGATNAEYIKFFPQDNIGISESYVKKPGSAAYEKYASGTRLTEEGEYSFYTVDFSGRTSEIYTLTLSREIPKAQLYVDDKPCGNNGYTNGGHIRFESDGANCYVKLPGSNAFAAYLSGAEYYKPGKYVFYGVSESGSSTGEYSIVIDRTVKPLELGNVENNTTNGDAVLTWTDGDPDEFAPVQTVTVNGKAYTRGEPIYTIDTGVYEVSCIDAAGNTWTTEFSSTKRNVLTRTLQKEYYEALAAEGEPLAFGSYDAAFAFAAAQERRYVRMGEWKSEVWDAGIAMDGKDSVNAKNGTYFVYKKSGKPKEQVAYFTEERLNEVIAEYAKAGITRYYYWQKEPTNIAEGENLYAYFDEKTVLESSIEFGENVACLIDGETFIGNVYDTEGRHLLTISDEWGNTCEYTLIVIRNASEIRYAVGGGSNNVAAIDRTYYFKDEVTVSIADAYDEMAMFSVTDENGGLVGCFSLDESCVIKKSGSYTVEAINHFGKSETFRFVLSLDAPRTELTENTAKKKLEVTVIKSADKESHIRSIEIYKSMDGGKTWILLEKDDYGKIISLNTLSYGFRTSGIYKVVLTDEFRSGFDAVVAQMGYMQPVPEGVLVGVENNGCTNNAVSFEWKDEAIVTLIKDGAEIEYVSGKKLKEDGRYVLTIENYDGSLQIYAFTIDTIPPEILLEGVKNGGKTTDSVTITKISEEAEVKVYLNNNEIGYKLGEKLTEAGKYRVVVTDICGNSSEYAFEIKSVGKDTNFVGIGVIVAVAIGALVIIGVAAVIILKKRRSE